MFLQFFENRNFPHSGRWDSIILVLDFDLLESNEFFSDVVSGFEDHSIGSFPKSFKSLVFLASLTHFSTVNESYNENYKISSNIRFDFYLILI